jgi:hypothetical protein
MAIDDAHFVFLEAGRIALIPNCLMRGQFA